MAFNNDQTEFPLGSDKRRSAELLPRYFRSDVNKKFLAATLDQILQPGVAEKLNGYFGRKTAKAFSKDDNYIPDIGPSRENYQLEPAAVVKDDLDNILFYRDYNDYINQLETFSANVSDHSVLNQQEYYSWNPNIDWDKITNFREYYWLPNGPDSVNVFGNTKEVKSAISVTVEKQDDNFVYKFSQGLTPNPTIKLYRGQTYRFDIDCVGHPIAFAISRSFTPGDAILVNSSEGVSSPGLYDATLYNGEYDQGGYVIPPVTGGIAGFEDDENVSTLYNDGVVKTEIGENDVTQTVVYVERGVIEFTVPDNAPDSLYYISNTDIDTSGVIRILDIEENSEINVEEEILGRKTYTTVSGFSLSNGMKVRFLGDVKPAQYAESEYIVEGVGESIKLVDVRNLVIPAAYTEDLLVPFDTAKFDSLPFGNANSYAATKDYIVINRASLDRNAWSRYNKWFHREVIEKSAEINGTIPALDQDRRAKRPIIEFEAGLKLYNFGTKAKKDVDLIDIFTTDAFSNIEGQLGYNVDGVDLVDGMRILFAADTDIRVKDKIFQVKFILHNNSRQISLIETDDSDPIENETILALQGLENRGKIWFYDGENWNRTQDKLSVNQSPLFDLFDPNGNSYADVDLYNQTSFVGSKVFSYKLGNGANDLELGIPLSYRNIENTGDILFDFSLLSESFTHVVNDVITTASTDTGFLRKYSEIDVFRYTNGWEKADSLSKQSVVTQYSAGPQLNDFQINVYDNITELSDLWIRVYINNVLKTEGVDFTRKFTASGLYLNFSSDLTDGDVVVIKTRSSAPKNQNGYYEFPHNFERNPLNENITEFTLGEVNDHVNSMLEDLSGFNGVFPGFSNLRDLGNVDKYGKKFLQHSGPLNLAVYHIGDESANLINAIKYCRYEYGKFKRVFLQTAFELGFDGDTKQHVDRILAEINRTKTNDMPFYFTDMVPYLSERKIRHVVDSTGDDVFLVLAKPFDLNTLSNRAVLVYLNENQLLNGVDYTFNDDGFCVITAPTVEGDLIEVYEYENTDGSFIPPTPTKLGLYPKFIPEMYDDDTYITGSVTVIQGHDGSIIKAYGDYRDELVLELEKRIYNNLKQPYREDIFDVKAFQKGAYRKTGLDKTSLDSTMISDFIQWVTLAGSPDYTDYSFYSDNNGFSYNYTGTQTPIGENSYGFWRAIYKYFYDTDRPHSHPWEMLGYSIKPTWWNEVYGPAPYTRDNLVLWQDLQNGIVRDPLSAVTVKSNFKRPTLLDHIPVDSQGKLLSPIECNFIKSYRITDLENFFRFGDHAPVETAWRRSSEYPFSLLTSLILNRPAHVIGTTFNLSSIERNLAGQLVDKNTQKRITLDTLQFPNTFRAPSRVNVAGLVNFISNYMTSNSELYNDYVNNLKSLTNQLGIKIAGYTDKTKFKLILDSRTPLNEGNVFVPEENYKIFLNRSPVAKVATYSGVIVEKVSAGFIIRGYDNSNSEFKIYPVRTTVTDSTITVGGISETYVEWSAGQTYTRGIVVKYSGSFYRCTETHNSTNKIDFDLFAKLPSLPLQGGARAQRRTAFENFTQDVPYGTFYKTIQEVVDFMYGYERWLKSEGFLFNNFNGEIGLVENWDLSIKEFLFWTLQNWSAGAAITLSPSANRLEFEKQYYVVDNVFDNFYDYSILEGNGKTLRPEFINTSRYENLFSASVVNTQGGIYGIKLPLTQTEHVILLDNKTVFNDVIYDTAPGYRQERIRALGYRTSDWDGSLNIPGFLYDDAKVTNWAPYTDYQLGDTVKYKEFYYAANQKITGQELFVSSEWNRLDSRPEPVLMTNIDYKANQFADFYDLDTDNFDVQQQKFAQHLIGYQNRKYLQNIINDDVSQYKFYQGFIQEKGTKNSLFKLFDALNSAEKESLEFYEEWAIRQSQYGASTGFAELEYKLEESKFKLNLQPIELVDNIPIGVDDAVYRILPDEVYVAPEDYDHTPFPVLSTDEEFVRSAGFVHPDDVDVLVLTKDDILNVTLDQLVNRSYVWVGQDAASWDILQLVNIDYKILSVRLADDGLLDFELDRDSSDDISVNDFVAFEEILGFSGMAKVVRVNGAILTMQTNVNIPVGTNLTISEIKGKLVSVKMQSLEEVNTFAEKNLTDDGLTLWTSDKVYQNQKVYSQQGVISNSLTWDSSDFHEFGSSIAVNDDNTVLVVGTPNYKTQADIGGIVTVYTRDSDSEEWGISQTLSAPVNVLGTQQGQFISPSFGKSVAISADGNYIAVGSPDATNVLTKYDGTVFDPNSDYSAGDVISYNESIWKAAQDVQRQVDNITYNTFSSYPVILEQLDSTDITLLVAGNYRLTGKQTDHLLIRAPFESYNGSEEGDTVVLKWNDYTLLNPTPEEKYEPFAGAYNTVVNSEFLSKVEGHTIITKIDLVLYVSEYVTIPEVGDLVYAGSSSGTVAYVESDIINAELIVYLKNVSGSFDINGTLINDGIVIGEYQDDFTLNSTVLGGFWLIETPTQYQTVGVWTDKGSALVYRDIFNLRGPDGDLATGDVRDSDDLNEYYNIQEYSQEINEVIDLNDQISFLTHLSYYGSFDEVGADIPSKFWVFRAPAEFTGTPLTKRLNTTVEFTSGQITESEISKFKFYLNDTGDLSNTGLAYDALNKEHSVFDLWDGYIDFEFSFFQNKDTDGDGRESDPFEPTPKYSKFDEVSGNIIDVVSDDAVTIVKDETTGATARVMFYQRFFNTVRLYVKDVSGTWSAGSNYGSPSEITRIGETDRKMGNILATSIVTESPDNNIGSLVVVENTTSFDPFTHTQDSNPELLDFEYWIYTEVTNILGGPRLPSIPGSSSLWREQFSIPADPTGTASGLQYEGLFTIYSKNSLTNEYDIDSSFTLPTRSENSRIGSALKFAQTLDSTTLFIAEKGDAINSTGRIYAFKKNDDWEIARDKNYKGFFNSQAFYTQDSLVINESLLYKAITNIAAGSAFNELDWVLVNSNVSRIGSIPESTDVVLNQVAFDPENGISEFVKEFDTNKSGSVLVTSTRLVGNDSTPINAIVVYREINGNYGFSQVLDTSDLEREDKILDLTVSINDEGTIIAVGERTDDSDNFKQGKVYIYIQQNGQFVLSQSLAAPNNEVGEGFGHDLYFSNNQLAVTSKNGDIKTKVEFDSDTTTFDSDFTTFFTLQENSGIVYLYETLENTLVFADRMPYAQNAGTVTYGIGNPLFVSNNHIYASMPSFTNGVDSVRSTDATFNRITVTNATRFTAGEQVRFTPYVNSPNAIDSVDSIVNAGLSTESIYYVKEVIDDNNLTISETLDGPVLDIQTHQTGRFKIESVNAYQGQIIEYKKPLVTDTSWTVTREKIQSVDLSKFRGVFIYDTSTNELLETLDLIDPIQGKIAGIAEQEISYKSYYDPAYFNVQNQVFDQDITNTWGEEQVGRLWWDLSTIKFYNAYQGDSVFQTNYWSKAFPNTTVDVYEWVETPYTPSDWDQLSGSSEGSTLGISGTTRYGSNFYVIKQRYDSVAQRFVNRYYYWVKDKRSVPNVDFRSLSTRQVADLIENPNQQGYKYVALMANNRFAIYNCNSLFKNSDIAINFRYWTIDNQEQNIHNRYQIITDGLRTSQPNAEIERKWFDSLVGYDEYGRAVPDPSLSEKQKYGSLFKPRQSWFKNRIEALKQVIDRVNFVLQNNIVVDDFDLSRLFDFDPLPRQVSQLYDVAVDTYDELQFVGVSNKVTAELSVVTNNGKITEVVINNSGRGYIVPPSITIEGSGEDAEIKLAIDNLGKVISATIVNGGSGYTDSTIIKVRPFSVLVISDRFNNNKWSMYARSESNTEWQISLDQQYDVREYWQYSDWYATGYNQFTLVDFEIDEPYQLASVNDDIGQMVKIRNVGSGGWMLLEKVSNTEDVDYIVNYNVIGRENGTIQFLSTLYDNMQTVKPLPITETRIILDTIKNNILVGSLAEEYNKLFFASLRYVFSEQSNVDWVFKTSFVKAIHNVGGLQQKVNFQNDNLPSYQSYVEEVKPYKTKIREYVSSYNHVEPSNTTVTDFDLRPTYDESTGKIRTQSIIVKNLELTNLSEEILIAPDEQWTNNVGFEVTDVLIADSGSGYTQAPVITLEGGGGTGAAAIAYVSNGKLTKIKVVNSGSGYFAAPRVIIDGNIVEGGTTATASAIIGNSVVRSTHIVTKFDRVQGQFYVTNLKETEIFTGSGSQTNFFLKWPMDNRSNKVSIFVNNVEALRSEYSFFNIDDNSKSYSRKIGKIEFTDPPPNGSSIEVVYYRNIELLTAQDRVSLFYEPTTGMIGNDVAQLMDGVDYGGVEVRSLEFEAPSGWDTQPWYSTLWDTYDNTFEDEVFTFDNSTLEVVLSKPLEENQEYNVYLDGVRIDDPNYDGSTVTSNPNARMQTLMGDGITQTLFLDNLKLEPYDTSGNNTGPDVRIDSGTSTLIIRKSTSDGSFMPDPQSYDVQLSGGDLAYTTATGINSEDIIVDGDGFVTPTTSKGPEELVPGQVVDTLDLKVYHRIASGGSYMYSQSYNTDGTTQTYDLGVVPSSSDAIFVRLNKQTLSDQEYTVDYENNTITLASVPSLGSELHILTMSVAGNNILDIDSVIADGDTTEFVTRAEWGDQITTFATIDGQTTIEFVAVNSDNRVTLRFDEPPSAGSTIVYGVFYGTEQSFSQVKRDNFIADGSTTAFTLSQTPVGTSSIAHNLIVKQNDKILNAGYNKQFVALDTQTTYALDAFQQPNDELFDEDFLVYRNGILLIQNQDYRLDLANSSIVVYSGVLDSGDILNVFVSTDGEYRFENNQVIFDTAPLEDDVIEITQFSNHDVQDIERINLDVVSRITLQAGSEEYETYQRLTNGFIRLRELAIDAKYVWVVKNGQQLTPNVDYYITENRRFVKILDVSDNDVLEVIHFTSPIQIVGSFGYRQFKDMLNRTHYKRLNDMENYELAQDLNWFDPSIKLVDASSLPTPSIQDNAPGILFINNERIEYFIKDGNTLRQIRRGTLGTGVPEVHPAGTAIQYQGSSENIPYKDNISSQVFVADGNTNAFTLDFEPSSVDEFEVFAAGKRLRKTSMAIFDPSINQDSPEGDVQVSADFTLNGNVMTLLETPLENQKIIIVKKQGLLWAPLGTSLSTVDNEIGRFLRAATVELPK